MCGNCWVLKNTAGGLMTNEFIELEGTATVETAVDALKNFGGALDAIHSVCLVAAESRSYGSRAAGAPACCR